MRMRHFFHLLVLISAFTGSGSNRLFAQIPPQHDPRIYEIIEAVSAERIEADIRRLAAFGTRNTLSDTVSDTRGIGAARRWIKAEFERISADCTGCLEVKYHRGIAKAADYARIPTDTWVVNVMAIKRGSVYPDRYVMMSGDIDSRASDPSDGITDAPGANDNASGMAGVIEAARVLSKYDFPTSIVFLGLSGEEQGLIGGQLLAADVLQAGWDIVGIINNDMIGNIEGLNGVIDNTHFRVFSEPGPPSPSEKDLRWNRFYGGEVDGASRQLARYIERMTGQYMTNLQAKMIYRLDRFGRGGHHKPFSNAGFPGVRIMETHEQYERQHQDIRVENGISYGDVIEGVNFDYAAKLTSVNAITLAALGWAPPAPASVQIGGAVQPSTRLRWETTPDPSLIGYKVYWRETTAPQWQYARFVGMETDITLKNIIIDNYLFGVAAVGKDGNESLVVFPRALIPGGE